MDEYISREATVKAFCEKCKGYYDGHCVHRGECDIDVIQTAPAADVQPVNQWISVNEALPIYNGLVLICYNDKRIRLGVYTEDGWDSDEGNPIMEQPDFWARIPEPPKDGDTE